MTYRDSHIDNLKVFLICFVVVGHFIQPIEGIEPVHSIFCLFRMPLFVFLCGYFSKKPQNFFVLIRTLLIPYVIFEVLYYLFYEYIMGSDRVFNVFKPFYTLWYLLSLFTWRCSCIFLRPLFQVFQPFTLIAIAIFCGIMSGYNNKIGIFMSLSRTIVFFPFFVMGYFFNKEKYQNFIDRPIVKINAFFLLVMIACIVFLYPDVMQNSLFRGDRSYVKMGLDVWYAGAYRFLYYGFSSLIGLCVFVLMPRKRYFFTSLGERTFNVYLIHGFIVKLAIFGGLYPFLHQYMGPEGKWGSVLFFFCVSVLLVWILSSRWVNFILRPILKPSVKKSVSSMGQPISTKKAA